MGKQPLLTAKQVAAITGLSTGTIYNLAYRRALTTVKLGSALRFRQADIDKMILSGLRPERERP